MTATAFTSLICPLDSLPLTRQGQSLCCENNHSFDISSKGYVNLLPAQHKRSLNPGDSKIMVDARRCFLEEGHYLPIAQQLNGYLGAQQTGANILDAGCGDGYYLTQFLRQTDRSLAITGVDISKEAIASAAKGTKNITWLVASNSRIPVASQTQNLMLCMFGFPVYSEFKRLLKDDGFLLMVDPGENHLIELRREIYPTIKPFHSRVVKEAEKAGFSLQDEQCCQFTFTCSQPVLQSLLQMTPHFFRSTKSSEQISRLLADHPITAEVAFRKFTKNCSA